VRISSTFKDAGRVFKKQVGKKLIAGEGVTIALGQWREVRLSENVQEWGESKCQKGGNEDK